MQPPRKLEQRIDPIASLVALPWSRPSPLPVLHRATVRGGLECSGGARLPLCRLQVGLACQEHPADVPTRLLRKIEGTRLRSKTSVAQVSECQVCPALSTSAMGPRI